MIYGLGILIVCVYCTCFLDELTKSLGILKHRAGTQMVVVERLVVMICLEDRAPENIEQAHIMNVGV